MTMASAEARRETDIAIDLIRSMLDKHTKEAKPHHNDREATPGIRPGNALLRPSAGGPSPARSNETPIKMDTNQPTVCRPGIAISDPEQNSDGAAVRNERRFPA